MPGEELVVSDDVYRVTFRYFERGLAPTGVVTRYADLSGDVARAIASDVHRPNPHGMAGNRV